MAHMCQTIETTRFESVKQVATSNIVTRPHSSKGDRVKLKWMLKKSCMKNSGRNDVVVVVVVVVPTQEEKNNNNIKLERIAKASWQSGLPGPYLMPRMRKSANKITGTITTNATKRKGRGKSSKRVSILQATYLHQTPEAA